MNMKYSNVGGIRNLKSMKIQAVIMLEDLDVFTDEFIVHQWLNQFASSFDPLKVPTPFERQSRI